jgi:hypothetical protein
MIDGWRISAFIPSGRKRTESILLTNLRRFDPIIDEVQVWLNTDGDERDRENHLSWPQTTTSSPISP